MQSHNSRIIFEPNRHKKHIRSRPHLASSFKYLYEHDFARSIQLADVLAHKHTKIPAFLFGNEYICFAISPSLTLDTDIDVNGDDNEWTDQTDMYESTAKEKKR